MSGMTRRSRVSYFYDSNISCFHFAENHPMKPFRIRMTDSLVMNYGLYKHMNVNRPDPATFEEMTRFHTDDYIRFLQRVSPELYAQGQARLQDRDFNFGDDCPPFEGIFDFSTLSAGGSIQGAQLLASGESDIAINWGGGLHHAKKTEASGFCYVNDIVLAILELLKTQERVLYVDVDVHHGDGVEEAFYTTDRVMTVSFHLFGNGFFPGTGHVFDVGVGKGKYYAANVPLLYGIDDEAYHQVFQPVMARVMEWYRPSVVVLQLGADSLAGDRLGMFNLSMRGHGRCVEYMKKFNVPILMLGGGGYTIRNVARAWTYETARAVGVDLPSALPHNEFLEYFGPEYQLDVPASNITNTNTREHIQGLVATITENLRNLPFAPSVQLQDVPVPFDLGEGDAEDEEDGDGRGDPMDEDGRLDDSDDRILDLVDRRTAVDIWRRHARRRRHREADPDVRKSQADKDKRIARDDEYSDSDDDGDEFTSGTRPRADRRRDEQDYRDARNGAAGKVYTSDLAAPLAAAAAPTQASADLAAPATAAAAKKKRPREDEDESSPAAMQ
ncbi:hypothetical protein H9P43_000177 [Blastocladiella emersonii ATCC 22665]|nr:hypothetical protein H9P43_000177 [Blastocladiella emersonii ATCC 22665]